MMKKKKKFSCEPDDSLCYTHPNDNGENTYSNIYNPTMITEDFGKQDKNSDYISQKNSSQKTKVKQQNEEIKYSRINLKRYFVYGDAISVPTIIDVIDYNDWETIKKNLGFKKTLTETIKEADMTKIFSGR